MGKKREREVLEEDFNSTDAVVRASLLPAVELSKKERAFVACYDFDAAEAAQAAGYTGSRSRLGIVGRGLLRRPEILAALNQRLEEENASGLHATVPELRVMWTKWAKDESIDIDARLKASKLLADSQGAFVQRVQHSGSVGIEALIEAAARKPDE